MVSIWPRGVLFWAILAFCHVSDAKFINGACPHPDAPISELCGLNGTCIIGPINNGIQTHWCSCDDGFGGNYCEKKCDLKCGNGQKCVFSSADVPVCVCKDCGKDGQRLVTSCPDGFGGKNCSKQGWCYPDKCFNGGKCSGEGDAAMCLCPSGLTGERCEIDVDECQKENACTNGKCINYFGHHKCICPPGFLPPTCYGVETPQHNFPDKANCLKNPKKAGCEQIEPCQVKVSEEGSLIKQDGICQNFGFCEHFGKNQTRCECPVGFEGEFCEEEVDFCRLSPCQNRGTCMNQPGGYKCMCMLGFEGENCETNIDDCVNNQCAKGSKCIDGPMRYDCECEYGKMGQFCDKIDPCIADAGLCGHGKCFSNSQTGGFECVCEQGYEGEYCNIDIDECANQNRQRCHKGACVNLPGSYKCDCFRGYTGSECHVSLDTCKTENVTCQNGGLCLIAKDRAPVCQCPQGFVGKRCEVACSNGVGGVNCDLELSTPYCDRRGLGGFRCKNGGRCDLKGFCSCPIDFTGNLCETPREEAVELAKKDSCRRDPCMNNATCIDVEEKIGYVCMCSENFEGDLCEKKKDFCSTSPCFNGGKCVSGGWNKFSCECPTGYVGKRCENEEIFKCSNSKCENGGVCLESGNTSRCECSHGFTGPKCAERVDIKSYEVKDRLLRDMCIQRNCSLRANDGNCDLDCSSAPCGFDGGDCSGKQQPFAKCRYGNMCADLFANGICDQACNNEDCLYDGMDCLPKVPRCPTTIRSHCAARFANGICDVECDSDACGFDGGDCESKAPTQGLIILSDIRIKLLVAPSEFQKDGGRILMGISSALRSVIRIQRDEEGPLVFEWNRKDESEDQGERLVMDTKDLEARNLLSSSVSAKRGVRNIPHDVMPNYEYSIQEVGKIDVGVVVWLEVEVSDSKFATSSCALSMDKASCLFSSSQSVVDYLSAKTAKKVGDKTIAPIFEAMVAKPTRGGNSDWTFSHVCLAIIVGVTVFGSIIGAIIMNGDQERSRKRKIISAPVWIPPTEQEKSRKGHGLSSSQSSLLECSKFFDPKRKRTDQGYNVIEGQFGQQQGLATKYGEFNYADNNLFNGMLDLNGIPVDQAKREEIIDNYPLHLEAFGDGAITSTLDAKSVNVASTNGRRVLHWLAVSSLEKPGELICEEARKCLDAGAEVNARDCDDNTALMLAVKTGRVRLAAILMGAGGDPTIFNKSDRSALHEAAVNLDFQMMTLLLKSKKMIDQIDELDRNGMTAFMEVVRFDTDVHCMKLLIAKGAKIEADGVSRKDSDVYRGRTALHYAAAVNNLVTLNFLLAQNANKDKQDEAGQTPLMLAAKEGHIDAVRALVQSGASLETTDCLDKTARELALSRNHYDLVQVLDMAAAEKEYTETAARGAMQFLGGRLGKNGRPTIKAVKRSASRKGYPCGSGSRDSTMHMTPPPSDGSMSSPSPQHFFSSTSRATPTGMHYPPSPMYGSTAANMPPHHHLHHAAAARPGQPMGYNPMSNQSSSSSSGASSTMLGMTGAGMGIDSSPEYHQQDLESHGNVSNSMWYGSSPSYQRPASSSFNGMRFEPTPNMPNMHAQVPTEMTAANVQMDQAKQSAMYYSPPYQPPQQQQQQQQPPAPPPQTGNANASGNVNATGNGFPGMFEHGESQQPAPDRNNHAYYY